MLDALRSYAALASGLTEATATKAREVAGALVEQALALTGKGTDLTGQVTDLADDLLETGKENREALTQLVRAEVDRAIGRVGFVREDELAALRRHVQRLEQELGQVRDRAPASGAPTASAPTASAPVIEVTEPVEAPATDAAQPLRKTKTRIAD